MTSTVRDVMSEPLPSVRDDDPVVAVARRLRAHRAAAVPVCDADGGFLGMLTATDVIDRCVADGQNPRVMRAGSMLDGPGPVLDPDQEPDAALLNLILNQRLPMLPVVHDGRLVGTLTLDDFAGHLVDAQDNTTGEFMIGDTSWWPTDL
jgi:CBS domain-containing protein